MALVLYLLLDLTIGVRSLAEQTKKFALKDLGSSPTTTPTFMRPSDLFGF
jgi:hypothetical protein